MYVYRVQGCQILQRFSITVMTFNKSGTLIDERFHKARVGTLCFTKGGIYKEAFMSLVCLCMCECFESSVPVCGTACCVKHFSCVWTEAGTLNVSAGCLVLGMVSSLP